MDKKPGKIQDWRTAPVAFFAEWRTKQGIMPKSLTLSLRASMEKKADF